MRTRVGRANGPPIEGRDTAPDPSFGDDMQTSDG